MDKFVFDKFDLARKVILVDLEKLLNKTKNSFAAKGMYNSGLYIKTIYDIVVNSAKQIMDVLLASYKSVQDEVGDNTVVDKEEEIRKEVNELFGREYERIRAEVKRNVPKDLPLPSELSNLFIELQEYARTKTDILIETERRKIKTLSTPEEQKSSKNEIPVIFISYADGELALADFVKKIIERLSEHKIEVFVAKRNIPPGSDPLKVIETKLKTSSSIISICSIKAKNSDWVWWESAAVWGAGNTVYPLFTNISASAFGVPLNLFTQGMEYFNKNEFIGTLRALFQQLQIGAVSIDLNSEDLLEYEKLKQEYSKKETSAGISISYKVIEQTQQLHKYSLNFEIENKTEKRFEDVVLELYFPVDYLETEEWGYPHLSSSVPKDMPGYICLTFAFSGLGDNAKRKFLNDLLPGKKLKIFGEDGMNKLLYEMDQDRWWKRSQFEILWKVYINGGAPQEGSIPLNSMQYF